VPLFIWGYSVTPEDARNLVATLLAAGSDDARTAAASIARALDGGGGLVGLDDGERDAVFFALIDPPEGLVELRGALSRDHVHRWGEPPVEH